MGDDLVWMDLTSLAEEKYPYPKEKWIKIKEDSLAFILFSLHLFIASLRSFDDSKCLQSSL